MNEILATPWLPSVMSQDCFLCILRYLYLVDSTRKEGYDILFKIIIRLLIDHLAAIFPKYYSNVSIDEMMIGTRCRISFLQYMYIPKKLIRFEIKIWILVEAERG
jgi:hypothetical protein